MNNNNFLRIFLLTPLKSGLITNSECLLSASALSNIAAHSSKVLSILNVKIEVTKLDIKKKRIDLYSRLNVIKTLLSKG